MRHGVAIEMSHRNPNQHFYVIKIIRVTSHASSLHAPDKNSFFYNVLSLSKCGNLLYDSVPEIIVKGKLWRRKDRLVQDNF